MKRTDWLKKAARRTALPVLALALTVGASARLQGTAVDSVCDGDCIPDDVAFQNSAQADAPMEQDGQEHEAPPEKRVFLTFDDGPSPTTETILEELKAAQVPATFFVIAADNNEKYLPLVEKIVAEGHQIALHSCSHEYKKIYQSPEAYWNDIKQLKEKLAPYVNADTLTWLRFPGGSTNTVSRKYGGSGIMKTLKSQAEENGYHYVDWNVCADDAVGGRPSASKIVQNTLEDVEDKKTCVVLMHDTSATKTTAEALPEIIEWFKEEGFAFCRVEELAEEN